MKFVQRSNQPLCRPNPKLAGEVSKLKQTAEKLSQQESQVNQRQEEPSDSLEDCEIAVIQNFISSMGSQAPRRTQSTTSAFLTDVKDESEPLRKTETNSLKAEQVLTKIGAGISQKPLMKKIEPDSSSAMPNTKQTKAASPQAKSSKIPELASSKTSEKESSNELRTKLATLVSQLEQLMPKIKQRKLASGLENVQKTGKTLMNDQTADKAKGLKQSLNKAAMAFLIIESSKHQVMKKDFNQTL